MSDYKITGFCTCCNDQCFEILQLNDVHERNPGEPKRVGAPFACAVRITYRLLDGTVTDLTFCQNCANTFGIGEYNEVWQKIMRSWLRQSWSRSWKNGMPNWFQEQFNNGIAYEITRQSWKEVCDNALILEGNLQNG